MPEYCVTFEDVDGIDKVRFVEEFSSLQACIDYYAKYGKKVIIVNEYRTEYPSDDEELDAWGFPDTKEIYRLRDARITPKEVKDA